MGRENIIELNGKRYDAITGAYLGKSQTKPVPVAPSPAVRQGRVIDSVIRPSASTAQPAAVPQPSKHRPDHAKTPAKQRPHVPKHLSRQPEHARTLMRHAVKKPAPSLKPAIKPQTPIEIAAAPLKGLTPKKSATAIDPVKLQHARQTQRHQQVQRFPRTEVSAVRYAAPSATHTRPAHPRPAAGHHGAAHQHTSKPADIFEAAIARATSHEQQTPKHARQRRHHRRIARLTTAVATLLVVGGLLVWLQWPHVELRVASFQAGFQASMPSHQLDGYERSTIRHEHGQIVMSYHSGDTHYRITQQSSNWNSRTLLDSAVAGASTEEPRVIESKGRIVYLYGNNASWVDGGVRYDITGNAPLTPDDIRAIVDSM